MVGDPAFFLVRHRMLVLLVLGVLLYVPFNGLRDVWYPDEPDIAEVALAMFVSGDWIAPRRMGEIWIDYPPMVYWTGTLTSHLLGVMSAFSLRLSSALAAIALVLITCAIGSRWFDARTGLWAGVVLLTFQHFVYEAVSYRPDMAFALFMVAGLALYAYPAGEPSRWRLRIGAFALFGLAILAKGPLGVLLPGLVLTLWHGSRREWRRLFEQAPLAVVSLAVALPWYVACGVAMGSENLWWELWAQNFARFGSGFRGHEQPFYYYAEKIPVDLMPWSVLLPFAIGWMARERRSERHVQLLFWWLGAAVLFLSIAVTKRQVYLLPVYPAAALIVAPWLSALTGPPRPGVAPDPRAARWLVAAAALVFLAVGSILVGLGAATDQVLARIEAEELERQAAEALRLPLVVSGAVILAGGVWITLAWRRQDLGSGLFRTAAAHVLLYVVAVALILPGLDPIKTYAPQSRWVKDQIGDEERFGLYFPGRGHHKMGAFGYHSGAFVELLWSPQEVDRFLRLHPGSLVLVHEDGAERMAAYRRGHWQARVLRELRAGSHRYLAVRGPEEEAEAE